MLQGIYCSEVIQPRGMLALGGTHRIFAKEKKEEKSSLLC